MVQDRIEVSSLDLISFSVVIHKFFQFGSLDSIIMAENAAGNASIGNRSESVSNGERGIVGRPRGISTSNTVGTIGRSQGTSTSNDGTGVVGRVRRASVSAADAFLNFNPRMCFLPY